MAITVEGGIDIGPGITIGGGGSSPSPNLLFEIDAQDYSGSGTTWPASVGTNATLFNTPTYNASSPTYFSFDKNSFEYASTTNLSSRTVWSIESWFRVTSSIASSVTAIVADQFNLSTNLNFSMGTNRMPTSSNICIGYYNGAWRTTNGFAPTLNTWYHCVGTYDGTTIKQYVNDSLNTQLSYTGTSATGGLSLRIARRWDDSATVATNFFPGDVAIVRIYSNALTAGEVTASYNADKARFGY